MSINIRDNLLLPSAILANPQTTGNSTKAGKQQDGVFAGKLDLALETGGTTSPASPSKAQYLAETLSLQMLHTSLTLAGENSDEYRHSPMPFDLTSQHLKTVVNAYSANQTEDLSDKSHPLEKSSQLNDMDPAPVAASKPLATAITGGQGFDPIIARASSRYDVDIGLIKAIIKTESNFNPNAVSHAGAQGLMQLMPGTARSLGVSDSFDPEQNVMAGTRFLSDLLKRYNGDLDSALAAYNWGPGNVDRKPDRLPRETRDYLARVKQLYSSYTA
jgi:hypothetical protein